MPGPCFADLLDAALAVPAAADAAEPRRWARTPAAPAASTVLLFATPLTSRVPRWLAAAGAPAARRSPHRLTADQQQAFDRLRLLGAELHAGFTAGELRREFRRLARRFHPDAQGSGTAVDRAAAARCFAEAADACRRLSTVLD